MRTSPVHYIAPSAISIIPNANGSQRDLAVNVDRNAKIKVCYQPIADLAYDNANYKEWTLRGRNRRLADADVPYTIYARLKKNDRTDGYLVFAQQIQDEVTSEWRDPYILTPNTSTTSPMRAEGADGEKYLWAAIPDRQATQNRTAYWWVKLGTVSQADSSGNRSVDLDTGILGTDQYNVDWYLDPDKMPEKPLRVVFVERGEWTDAPTVVYTGTTGEMKPDGTLDADTATILGWTGSETLSFTQGQMISEPYHYRHLTRCRWLTHRLAEYNNGYTDQELFERLNKPTRGWEEENWVETSRVWRNGELWECLTEGTTDEPSQERPNWKLLLQGGEDALNVELTKSADAVVIDPSGNIVGGYRTVSKDSTQNEFYTYRFFTSATVMRGGGYLHLCGAMDDNEELGEGNYTIEAVGAGCDLKVEGSTVYITSIWHCNDGDAGTDPYTSYNRTPEEYQLMRAMTEAVAHITLNIEGKTAVTKDYRLQLVHLPTDTITLESHNEVAALNWSTKRNAWTNIQDIVIPLTASSGGQPVMFQTVNGGTAPDIRLLDKPGWLSGTPGYSVAWADYDEDGDGHAEYTASQHMSVEITIPIANILRTWQENNTTQEIPNTNLLKFNVTTIVDGVEYENVVPFTLNVTTDKAIYVLAPSVRQVTGTMIGGTWDPQTNTVSNARYSYVAAGEACNKVTCRLMCYDQNDNLTEITSASAIHDNLTFFINGQASTLEGFRTTGVQNTAVAGKDHNLFDELSEIVFAIKMDGRDYESEGVPILRNGANLSIGDDGNWYIGGVNTEVFAKGTTVTGTFIYYTDPMDASTPPAYSPATNADRGKPVSPYLKTTCPASVDGKFIHYVSITVFSDSEETYVYSYGTIGSGNTITVIHDRDFYASASELTQAQLKAIGNASWSESTPSGYSSVNKYLYSRDTARYYKNGAEQTITVGGISYPHIVYTMLAYWGQDGSGVEFAYYRAADDSAANKPTADVLNQRHAGTAKDPVIADWNGSDGGWFDDNPGFTTQGQVMYQSVNKYIGGTWSGWGDPVIIERYSQNTVRLDIDNEMDTVESDSTGKVTVARTVETVLRLYDGATEVDISSANISVSGGPGSSIATQTLAAAGKGKKLSLAFIAGKTMADRYNISIQHTYNGTTYYATLTITASKGQAVWQLKPSQSSIVYSRQSNNTLSSANNTLKLDVLKLDTGSAETKAATTANLSAWGLTIRYSTSSMPSGATDGTAWASGNSLAVASTTDNVYIAMFNTAGTLIDRETVPVVKDGLNGTDGKYEEKQFCRSAAATSTNGSTAPTNIDTSYGSSGWSETPPIPTRQYPFIWQRTRTIDPNTNTATSWVYVRLTGEAGEDGAAGKAGLWYAYAGIWGTDVSSVTNTETQGWYVQHNGSWYMNVKDAGSANTTTPGSGVDGWADMSSAFKFYIAEAYFGNYAHLGSFIINGDWMISQYGTLYDSSGTAITVGAGNYQTSYSGKVPYAWFDPAYPTSNKTGSYNFCPNFAVDGKTGKTYQQDAYIKGEVHATSGIIGGITLSQNAMGSPSTSQDAMSLSPSWFFLNGGEGTVVMAPVTGHPPVDGYACVFEAIAKGLFPAVKAIGRSVNGEVQANAIEADGKVYITGDIQVTGNYLDANGQPIGGGTGGHNFNTNQFTIDSNNTVSLANSFTVGGTITANDFALSSDERKKNIIELINLSVEKIAQARIVLFKWKDKSLGEHINGGLIAQDWLSIAPWAVPEGDDGFLGVRYSQLAAVMGVECAREIVKLQEENEALKDELKSVKSEVKSLRDELAELRAMVKSMMEGK